MATLDDVLFISGLLRRFYRHDGEKLYQIPYDHDSCIHSVEREIENGVVVVGPRSCAGATIFPFTFNYSIKLAQVLFWTFENPRECLVFDALCRECAKRGAAVVNVASLAPKHGAKKYYARRGLYVAEAHHIGLNPEFGCALRREGAKDTEMNDLASPIGGPS